MQAASAPSSRWKKARPDSAPSPKPSARGANKPRESLSALGTDVPVIAQHVGGVRHRGVQLAFLALRIGQFNHVPAAPAAGEINARVEDLVLSISRYDEPRVRN